MGSSDCLKRERERGRSWSNCKVWLLLMVTMNMWWRWSSSTVFRDDWIIMILLNTLFIIPSKMEQQQLCPCSQGQPWLCAHVLHKTSKCCHADALQAWRWPRGALLKPEIGVPDGVVEPADVLQHWMMKMPPFWKDLEDMAEKALYESIKIEIEKKMMKPSSSASCLVSSKHQCTFNSVKKFHHWLNYKHIYIIVITIIIVSISWPNDLVWNVWW